MNRQINIQLVRNDDIDKNRWDQTMDEASNGIAFGYSWYLDATFPNWSALISDDYTYIFPLSINRKLGVYYLYSPIYTMQLGIYSKQIITDEIIQLFFNKLPRNIYSIDYSTNQQQNYIPLGFHFKRNTCQYIDLSKSYTEIIKGYSSNLKRNLKKAIKADLSIVESTDIKSVVNMFKDHRGVLIKNVSEHNYQTLNKLITNTLVNKKGVIYQVYCGDELLASCFFSMTNHRMIYHKGGVNPKGKKLGAMHFLIDQLIKKYAGSNIFFDFGGSSLDAVKRFNENFGKLEYTYLQLQKGITFINLLRKVKNKLFQFK